MEKECYTKYRNDPETMTSDSNVPCLPACLSTIPDLFENEYNNKQSRFHQLIVEATLFSI